MWSLWRVKRSLANRRDTEKQRLNRLEVPSRALPWPSEDLPSRGSASEAQATQDVMLLLHRLSTGHLGSFTG